MNILKKQNKKPNKKGQIWIAAVLYIAVTILIVIIVLQAGLPMMRSMRDKAVFERTKDLFVNLNSYIQEVASEGPGSQRIIPIELTSGNLNLENNQIMWYLETDSNIIEPGSKIDIGNIEITSETGVKAYETNCCYILENQVIIANFSKVGTSKYKTNINTSSIINKITYKAKQQSTSGKFIFSLNNVTSGIGYTEMLQKGNNLAEASIVAHIENETLNYAIKFTLKPNTDFLIVNSYLE